MNKFKNCHQKLFINSGHYKKGGLICPVISILLRETSETLALCDFKIINDGPKVNLKWFKIMLIDCGSLRIHN
jgi:hypothetical protein